MMLVLPLVIVAFLFRYPAGLLVYWITTNVWTIVQQYFIRRRIGPAPPKAATSLKSSNGRAGTAAEPALAIAGVGSGPGAAPPRSPRKKKKRSGRRR
jgi:YidC/Oxa1 family membrane protein insertase